MAPRSPHEANTEANTEADAPPESSESRRQFLKLLAACSATCSVGCVPEAVSEEPTGPGDGPPPISGPISAGNITELSEDSLQTVPGWPLAIGRDQDGLWALTLSCTHLGCNIGDTSIDSSLVDYDQGLHCGCHGSRYSIDGDLLEPPATRDLRNYPVSVDEAGEVWIDTDGEVEIGTRTPVPESFA